MSAAIGMKPSQSELAAMLAGALSETGKWPLEGNVTCDFLAHFHHKWPQYLDQVEMSALDALCRKVDVARKVWLSYDKEWKNPALKEPLPNSVWPALIAAFLLISTDGDRSEEARGGALKFINAAFNALDFYEAADDSHNSSPLRTWAQMRLEEELAS